MTYTVTASPAFGTLGSSGAQRTSEYRYWLELDRRGRIVGGSWITRDRPDFLWAQSRPEFEGYFADVERIYDAP
jgi:Transglutaminase elicitor